MNYSKLYGSIPESVYNSLTEITSKYQINTVPRLSHFLSQCMHESANFTVVRENLNYSAEALLRVFPKYFTSIDQAKKYARQPEKIANRVYANRMGNGDEESFDGWDYRGRGFIQITGLNNYADFNSHVRESIIDYPDLVAVKYPLESAAWYWQKNGLNDIADSGCNLDTAVKVSKKINLGNVNSKEIPNGLNDRLEKFARVGHLLQISSSFA